MNDFLVGFFFAFPSAFLLSLVVGYFYLKCKESSIADDINIIKEDVANLTVKLSGFLNHV